MNSVLIKLTRHTITALLLLTSSLLMASDITYPASYFTPFKPQNAYEMLIHIPGFTFDAGSNERGFGNNAGNVLVNGSRPSAKSGGLGSALSRIMVANVIAIEIIRASKDTAGKSMVANIITQSSITSGSYAIKARQVNQSNIEPNIELAINRALGQWETAVDLDIGVEPGERKALLTEFDQYNTIVAQHTEFKSSLWKFYFANAQLKRSFDAASVTINSRIGRGNYQSNQHRQLTTETWIASQPSQWQLNEFNRYDTAELSIDYQGSIGNWQWHSIGLGLVEQNDYHHTTSTTHALNIDHSAYAKHRYNSEYISRNSFNTALSTRLHTELGVEITNNYLRTKATYIANDSPIILTNANISVEELRSELFANLTYYPLPALTIDTGINVEYSKIKVLGSNNKNQSFNFIKPRVSMTYLINNEMTLNVTAKHRAEQLNFNDFSATHSAENNRSSSGNSALKPSQTTELTARIDWKFTDKNNLTLGIEKYWKQDILTQIPLDNVNYGIGNAGNAQLWKLNAQLYLSTAPLLNNGLLKLGYVYTRSSYYDQIINHHRPLSHQTPNEFTIEFRQDITSQHWAWGTEIKSHFTKVNYLVDETVTFTGNDRMDLFVETTYFSPYKIQLQVSQVNVGKFNQHRQFYDKTRLGIAIGHQESFRRREPKIKLSLWGTF